jgi:CrcB protein
MSHAGTPQPIDPDVDLHAAAQVRERTRGQGPVLAVIAAGGSLGALARYGLARAWPAVAGGFPWATFVINVTGSFLIGLLMVAVTEIWVAPRLVRPFLGVGILGGFTTFSTYANDTRALLRPDSVGTAFAYLGGTLAAALPATLIAMRLMRMIYAAARNRQVRR